jgi:hypothetical protein
MFVFIVLVGCISNNSTDEKEKYLICENEDDIDKYDGEVVQLIGTMFC